MYAYTDREKQILLKLVDDAIEFGLENGEVMSIKLSSFSENLQKNGASFVTLKISRKLRGCIGTLEAYQPLVQDIIQNAYSAAFKDSRFKPVTVNEYAKLEKHISILSSPEKIFFTSEEDLLKKLQPNIDGIILFDKGYKATFLPSVWQELPKPKIFLEQLKLKASLPKDHWSKTMKIERYTVETIG